MSTLEIPRPEWRQFFAKFGAQHGGLRCKIEVLAESLGAQVQSNGMPFTGIEAEASDSAGITVSLGEKPEAHLTHTIDAPTHVWWMQAESGDEVLEIEGRDSRTLLSFGSAERRPRS
jgi:hypothetical protein